MADAAPPLRLPRCRIRGRIRQAASQTPPSVIAIIVMIIYIYIIIIINVSLEKPPGVPVAGYCSPPFQISDLKADPTTTHRPVKTLPSGKGKDFTGRCVVAAASLSDQNAVGCSSEGTDSFGIRLESNSARRSSQRAARAQPFTAVIDLFTNHLLQSLIHSFPCPAGSTCRRAARSRGRRGGGRCWRCTPPRPSPATSTGCSAAAPRPTSRLLVYYNIIRSIL